MDKQIKARLTENYHGVNCCDCRHSLSGEVFANGKGCNVTAPLKHRSALQQWRRDGLGPFAYYCPEYTEKKDG